VAKNRPYFEYLTAIFPNQVVDLETPSPDLSGRLINLISPIGRGQRGLIVSPPKAGKTFLLKAIAAGIAANYPDIHLMVALIGERPEEVTDMKRSVKGEVVASTFDEPVEDHKGTGNQELRLDRRLAERRVFPAIDIAASSTRREELLMDEATLRQVWLMRRMMSMIASNAQNPSEATERLLDRLLRTNNNA